MTAAAKLRAAQKKARETSAAVDEGLLGVSRGIDRLIRDRAELLAACEEAADWLENHGAFGAGSDQEEGLAGLRKQLLVAITKAKAS